MAKIDILKNPKRAVEFLRGTIAARFEENVLRAAEIVEEEYQEFFDAAAGAGLSGILGSTETERVERTRNGRVYKVSVFVPKEGGGGNQVFHTLDEGIEALGAAADYGHKVWPIHLPRDPQYGNTPMTRPGGGTTINMAGSTEDIIYRPVIRNPIEARNFTDDILNAAQKRIDDEDLAVNVKTSKQS